ncbi:MAG TPA: universal stress protein [Chryseolinea sp.]|nr:universal stress protein [Chryseolinea sp.]
MKTILVPCDFSKPAINAFRFALDIAEMSKGIVHLLNVVELPVLHDSMIMPVLSFEAQLLKDLRERSISEFNKLTAKYGKEKIKVITKVEFGSPTQIINTYAKKNKVDLIIMGSHGANGMREYFIGSNAEKIIRNSKIPVLILKDYYKGSIKHIVFPNTLDTENQEDLVMNVKALQHFFKATLHIVWVNTPANFTNDTVTLKRLEDFAKRFMFKNFTIDIYNHIDAEEGIRLFSDSIKANMIAMGTHGRKGVSHLLLGSLAESVANHYKGLIWTYSIKNDTTAG